MTATTGASVTDITADLGLWPGARLEAEAGPTMASPSWWGADSRRYSVRADRPDPRCGTAAFVKVMEPHTRAYVDVAAAFGAAAAAGVARLAPAVHVADAAAGVLVTDDHTGVSHTATLDLFGSPELVARLVALRRAVHALPAFDRVAGVFEDMRTALHAARTAGAQLPPDLPWMLRLLGVAEGRIAASGSDAVPIHGDANISNVLVLDSGELLLVDFDCAAMADPLQDLGCLLADLAPLDSEARPIFEMSWGSWDPVLFDRARLYGIADQVRWGLIGAYCDAARPGTHEYSKFSDWQFLRARAGLRDPHLDDRIRNL
jgi:thiamine kinase-like enzyme